MRSLVALLFAISCFAQAPRFDVTSVKPTSSPEAIGFKITTDPGRLKADNVSLGQLIEFAYNVPAAKIIGQLPRDHFDVEGQADGAHTRGEHRLMLQSLLAERFGLRLHRETREIRVDALVLGKSPKLQATDITDPDPAGFHFHSSKLRNHAAVEGRSISLEDLANYLTDHYHDRLVVDATGLRGVYDFTVDYEVDSEKVADPRVPFADARSSLMDDLLSNSRTTKASGSYFRVIRWPPASVRLVAALGLRIESGRRAPVEVLVIDHVSLPEAN
jgi:uncharacterized protein (TIGR03435 family)